jgi:hypothetical protein
LADLLVDGLRFGAPVAATTRAEKAKRRTPSSSRSSKG